MKEKERKKIDIYLESRAKGSLQLSMQNCLFLYYLSIILLFSIWSATNLFLPHRIYRFSILSRSSVLMRAFISQSGINKEIINIYLYGKSFEFFHIPDTKKYNQIMPNMIKWIQFYAKHNTRRNSLRLFWHLRTYVDNGCTK